MPDHHPNHPPHTDDRGLRLQTTLPASSFGVGVARRYVRDVLSSRQVTATVVETVVLLSSEVVTYAFRRARSPQGLLVVLRSDDVWVEVTGPGLRRGQRGTAVHGPRGRGRALIDALSLDWGIEGDETAGRLWFVVGR